VSVVQSTIADGIGRITLNRPERMNAITTELARELERALSELSGDPTVNVVVIRGADKNFCAGGDVAEVESLRSAGPEALRTLFEAFRRACDVIAAVEVPVVAGVEGVAMAGGFEIALSCDMIIASENSVFSLPEVTRGLIAAAGGLYRLVRSMPRALALELLATGDRLTAARAAEFGLVNHVTVPGGAIAEALALARKITANAPIAVRESMQIARRAFDMDDDELFALGLEAQKRIVTTQDFAEGPRAFIEKRSPDWKGC